MDTPSQPPSKVRPRRRRLLSCKCAAICLFLTAFVSLLTFVCLIAVPATVSLTYEVEYFDKLERERRRERRQKWLPTYLHTSSLAMDADDSPAVPLIRDIPQLSSLTWKEQMDMNEDWTGKWFGTEMWVYIGGTAEVEEEKEKVSSVKTAADNRQSQPQHQWSDFDGFNNDVKTWKERSLQKLTSFVLGFPRLKRALSVVYPLPGPTCIDPPETCRAFNQGFDRLIEFYHTHRKYQSANTALAFVDCDISPVLCSEWGLDPVLLVHIKTSWPGEINWMQGGNDRFPVQWRFVALPLKKMPFTRNVRLSALLASSGLPFSARDTNESPVDVTTEDPLVPVFPSALEQIHALVSFSGSVDALDFETWEMLDIVVNADIKIA